MIAIGRVTWPALPDADLVTTARLSKDAGFAHLEPTPDLTGIEDPANSPAACMAAVEAAQSVLPIPALAALVDLVSGDASLRAARAATVSRAIRLASARRVPIVTVYSGPDTWDPAAPSIPRDLPFADAWDRFAPAFSTLLDEAAAEGIKLAFKPILGTLAKDTASTLRVIAAWGRHPAFSLAFDPSHFAIQRDDLGHIIREWGPLLSNVHLKDGFGRPGLEGVDYHFPTLGNGLVDWPQVASGLAAIRYAGPISILDESTLASRLGAEEALACAQISCAQVACFWAKPQDLH
jgi:sugar phosphate isomerase/epimerase